MFYDPYDEEVQVKFLRTDPTGRIVPLGDAEAEARGMFRIGSIAAVIAMALIAWWLL